MRRRFDDTKSVSLPTRHEMPAGETENCALAREDTKALKEHIVALYCARYTCRRIVDLTGLSYRFVRDSLQERGITPVRRVLQGSRVRSVVRTDASDT